MSTLGKAVITFAADTATFIGDVGKAVASFERGIGRMTSSVRGLDGPLAKLTAGLTIAGVGLFAKNVIDSADEIGKLSQKLGISTEKLSEYRLAGELADLSNEQLAKGLRAFNLSLVEALNGSSKASKVFKALGVDIKAGPAEAFRQFAEQISQLGDGELKTAAASTILGNKLGADFIPMLNGGAKGLDDAGEKARNLGLIISDEFAKSAEKFNDNMKLIQRSTVGFANAVLSGGVLDTFANMAQSIEKSAEKGEKWLGIWREVVKVARSSTSSLPGLGDEARAHQEREADLLFNPPRQTVTGKIRGLKSERAVDGSLFGKPDTAMLAAALATNEAEVKRYVSALRGLEKQMSGLNNETAEETTLFELFGRNMTLADGSTVHLEGSLEQLTAAHKVNLLNLSLEVTRRSELKKNVDALLPALQAEAAAIERSSEILKDFIVEGRLNNDQIAFETSLLGLSSREQEKANALRQIELELRRRRSELATAAAGDDALFARENAKLEAEAARQREQAIKGIEERQRVERDWSTGAKQAFSEYVESATNAAEASRNAWTSVFRNTEDAMVEFVTTAKFNYKKMADAIIADLVRIEIRRNITGPLANGIQGIFSSGGGSSSGADAVSGDIGVNMAAMGGIMTSRGMLPLHSYASGGIARSPQLAVFGEGRMPEAFVPLPDGRRIPVNLQGAGGKGGSHFVIDARGADRQGFAELRAMIQRLDGSIEERSVSAVSEARQRGGRMSRSIGG